jgi:type II secretory pathway predicted ATPase ExeA
VSADADASKVSAAVFPQNGESKLVWVSNVHRQLLKTLDAAILGGRGVLLLTGEHGCGKTVLIRALLNGLVGTGVRVGRVTAPVQDGRDFYAALGYQATGGDFLRGVRGFLGEILAQGQRLLLVVDDAQTLQPLQFSELLRLLETHQHVDEGQIGVFNILLSGSSELEAILREPRYTGLADFIRIRSTLRPLTPNEVAGYVQYHLGAAGYEFNWFTPDAMTEICARSGGIPRTINVICDHTLRAALHAGVPTVNAEFVRQALPEELAGDGEAGAKGIVRTLLDLRRPLAVGPRPRTEPEASAETTPEVVHDLSEELLEEEEERRTRILRLGGATVLGAAVVVSLLLYFGWRSPSRDASKPTVTEREVDRPATIALPEKPESPIAATPPPASRAATPSTNGERPRAAAAEKVSPRRPEAGVPAPPPPRAAAPTGQQQPVPVREEATPVRQEPAAPAPASFKEPAPTPAPAPPARVAAPAVARPPAATDDPDPGAIIDWLLKQSPGRPD